MVEFFFRSDYAMTPVNAPEMLLALLLAFLCGQVIGWTYMGTHYGLSYSRSFVTSLVLLPVIVALVMMVLANNLVTAVGLMAVFAIVRFRNVLRDTLDTTFVLGCIVIGMGCGTYRYATAVAGCAALVAILLYLRFTLFGTRHKYDYILNVQWSRPFEEVDELRQLLQRHCRHIIHAGERAMADQEGAELSFRLLLRDPGRTLDLLREVRALAGITRASGITADDQSEM